LSGMDHYFLDACGSQSAAHHRGLDELWACSDDSDDFQSSGTQENNS